MSRFDRSGRGDGYCTDDMRPLDVRQLHRDGLLTPGNSLSWQWSRNGETTATINLRVESDRVFLIYSNRNRHHNSGDWEPMNYAVGLDWTPCPLGGRRVWWLCPVVGCGRRVAVLHGGRVFACRKCNRLTYRSQRETDDDRAARRANTIRRKLGWEPGILNGNGDKPKGMHWRTYWGLRGQNNDAMSQALAGIGARLGLLRERVDGIGSARPSAADRQLERGDR